MFNSITYKNGYIMEIEDFRNASELNSRLSFNTFRIFLPSKGHLMSWQPLKWA